MHAGQENDDNVDMSSDEDEETADGPPASRTRSRNQQTQATQPQPPMHPFLPRARIHFRRTGGPRNPHNPHAQAVPPIESYVLYSHEQDLFDSWTVGSNNVLLILIGISKD